MGREMISYGQNEKDNVDAMIEMVNEMEPNSCKENQVQEEVDERKRMNIVRNKWIMKEKEQEG